MCNEILQFLECGHQAKESKIDFCCYVLNTLDRMGLLDYSEADPRIIENDRKCGENHKTVLKTIAGMCQGCQLTSSLKYLAAESSMRLSPIGEAFLPSDNVSKSLGTSILDDRHTLTDQPLEREGAPSTTEAHINWPLQTEDAPEPAAPMEQLKLLWIYENPTVETLYTAIRAPPERSAISVKQRRLLWIKENPILTPPSPNGKTFRAAQVADLPKISSLIFEGESFYFPLPPSWTEDTPSSKGKNALPIDPAPVPLLLEH